VVKDVEQLLALGDEQVRGRHLLARLAQEVLLTGRAHQVGVRMAIAHVLQSILAAQLLVPGLDVDLRVLQ